MDDNAQDSDGDERVLTFEEQRYLVLKAIGDKLSKKRKDNSGVVQTISKDLRIRASLLHAIEEGNIAEFPGDSYYYGFARNYATALSVDISEEIKQYRVLCECENNPKTIDSALINAASSVIVNDKTKIAAATIVSTGNVVSPLHSDADNVVSKQNKIDMRSVFSLDSSNKSYGAIILVGAGFCVAFVYSLWIIFLGVHQDDVNSNGETVDEYAQQQFADTDVATEAGETNGDKKVSVFRLPDSAVQTPEKEVSNSTVRDKKGREYGNPVNARVWVKAITSSWISVVDVSKLDVEAGKTGEIFSRQLKANDVYYAPQGDQIFLKSGNAGGIRLVVDGKLLEPVGRNGQVRYVSLNAQSLLGGSGVTDGVKLFELLQAVKRAQER